MDELLKTRRVNRGVRFDRSQSLRQALQLSAASRSRCSAIVEADTTREIRKVLSSFPL